MRKLIAISIASASIAIGAIPAFAEVDSKIHKLCIEAKDYEGCVQAQSSGTTASSGLSRNAKDRTKRIKRKLYEFNLKQVFGSQPEKVAWVKANPKLAESMMQEELLFFKSNNASRQDCLKTGLLITDELNWEWLCGGIWYPDNIKEKNATMNSMINVAIDSLEDEGLEEEACQAKGKAIRRDEDYKCMSDSEYASHIENKRIEDERAEARRARIRYEEEQKVRKAERDRERWAAVGNALQGVSDALAPKHQQQVQPYSYSQPYIYPQQRQQPQPYQPQIPDYSTQYQEQLRYSQQQLNNGRQQREINRLKYQNQY